MSVVPYSLERTYIGPFPLLYLGAPQITNLCGVRPSEVANLFYALLVREGRPRVPVVGRKPVPVMNNQLPPFLWPTHGRASWTVPAFSASITQYTRHGRAETPARKVSGGK